MCIRDSDSTERRILIKLKKYAADELILSVSDNGVGLPDNFNIEDTESLGLKLVTSLIQQIEGKLEVHPKDYTEFKITFKGNIL